jgi:hypothetical protein
MLITVKDTISREVIIMFPSFYKVDSQFSNPTYFAFFSDKIGLCVSEGFTYQVNPERAISDNHKTLVECYKSEVEEVFLANQKLFATTMEGITVDLNSNTPTEVLEQVKFERQSESVEMKHDFNK